MENTMLVVMIFVVLVVMYDLAKMQLETRKTVRRQNYCHDHEKYLRAWQKRRRHEEQHGEDNVVTHFRLQELIRMEVGALSILRNYYPLESDHLEVALRVLTKRMDDTVIR